MVHPV